jgi:hypothetical protein
MLVLPTLERFADMKQLVALLIVVSPLGAADPIETCWRRYASLQATVLDGGMTPLLINQLLLGLVDRSGSIRPRPESAGRSAALRA